MVRDSRLINTEEFVILVLDILIYETMRVRLECEKYLYIIRRIINKNKNILYTSKIRECNI